MSSTLDILKERFPGQVVLTSKEVASVLRKSHQAVYNQMSKREFPIRPIRIGTGPRTPWCCSVVDVAHYIDTGEIYVAEKPKRKRGRPRKTKLPTLPEL